MKVDVIIPTYKPGEQFFEVLKRLYNQTVKINRVIIMNTEEKYLDTLFYGHVFGDEEKLMSVYHVTKLDFDHGKTRNLGASHSDADVMVFMTQDALPEDEHLIEELLKGLEKEDVGVCYARQLPYENASIAERFSRQFNYPDEEKVKSREDIDTLGIKAFFCSNVCAAYDRALFESLHGFVNMTIFNEDMIYANKVLKNGRKIAYAPKAMVRHSHDYSNMQQFKRNFDIAVSQKMYPEVFDGVSSESEGIRYVKAAFKFFVKEGRPLAIFPFVTCCGYRFLGFKFGKKYKSLPKRWVLKMSSNPRFFMKNWDIRL